MATAIEGDATPEINVNKMVTLAFLRLIVRLPCYKAPCGWDNKPSRRIDGPLGKHVEPAEPCPCPAVQRLTSSCNCGSRLVDEALFFNGLSLFVPDYADSRLSAPLAGGCARRDLRHSQ